MPTNKGADPGSEKDSHMASRRREAVMQIFAAFHAPVPDQQSNQAINEAPVGSSLPKLSAADQDMLDFAYHLETSLGPAIEPQYGSESSMIPGSSQKSSATPTGKALTIRLKEFKVKEEFETYYARQDTIDYIRSQLGYAQSCDVSDPINMTAEVRVVTAETEMYGELDLETIRMIKRKLEEDTKSFNAPKAHWSRYKSD